MAAKNTANIVFQSTPSARRATSVLMPCSSGWRFQSTPSARRATARWAGMDSEEKFQSTPSARRETAVECVVGHFGFISIHALREESDSGKKTICLPGRNFNPRPPRGERPRCHRRIFRLLPISIHALREESDSFFVHSSHFRLQFQSTPSARRATDDLLHHKADAGKISIHALREESDRLTSRHNPDLVNFNPRPPRGERQRTRPRMQRPWVFQSTPSARRATVRHDRTYQQGLISIHALREESDFCSRC